MTPDQTHETVAPMLGAYALDAVEPDEAMLVETHLDECAPCRAEVARHRGVAAHFAHSYDNPPAELWDRIASQISAESELPADLERRLVPAIGPIEPTVPTGPKGRRRVFALAAAIVMVVAISGIAVMQRWRISDLEDPSLNDLALAALDEPASNALDLVGEGLRVQAVIDADGHGFLFGDDLPDLPTGRAYQLWSVNDGQAVSLGVVGTAPGTVAFSVPAGTDAIAITEEPDTGVAQPSQAPLVSANLSSG